MRVYGLVLNPTDVHCLYCGISGIVLHCLLQPPESFRVCVDGIIRGWGNERKKWNTYEFTLQFVVEILFLIVLFYPLMLMRVCMGYSLRGYIVLYANLTDVDAMHS